MENFGIYKDTSYNKTDKYYNFDNGSVIEFFSADNNDKLRGSKRDILYINEANLVSVLSYRQLAMRTTQKIFIDFNPAEDDSWVYNLSDKPDTYFIKSTYKNNLQNISKEQIKEIENFNPEINPYTGDLNTWRVFGLGERGSSLHKIFTHFKEYEILPNYKRQDVFYGLDFGFHDPTVLIEIRNLDGAFYCKELIYETQLVNNDVIEIMKKLNVNENSYIYCDSAEPARIKDIQKTFPYAQKAKKEVKAGIDKLKGLPLYLIFLLICL